MAKIEQEPLHPINNPYVGPRTFRTDEAHLFFGREREARELTALIISKRLVLFYAQSGTGKSSLLNTRLIPSLTVQGFEVLPVGRIGGQSELGQKAENVFVLNLMLSLQQDANLPADVESISLPHFLDNLIDANEGFRYDPAYEYAVDEPIKPRILIIDQFEEILTSNPIAWDQREGLFQQLGAALDLDNQLWLVLIMREDFVAALDPYLHHLPGRLRDRYYMQRLNYDAAREAVRNPAAKAGRPFAPGAAERLVDNLRQIRLAEQESATYSGEYIEPVQLQTVCFQMWESLQSQPGEQITTENLQDFADVDQALARFYEETIAETVAETDVSEIDLRDWFEHDLITDDGTRGMVYRGDQETGRLPTSVVNFISTKFMLRTEVRAGGTWYELVHDRFIQPILDANGKWRLEQPLIQLAQEWQDAGRHKEHLLTGTLLSNVLESNWQMLGSLVMEFIEASQEEQQRQDNLLTQEREEARQRELERAQQLAEEQRMRAEDQARAAQSMRRQARIAIGIGVVTTLLAIAAGWFANQALDQRDRARTAEAEAARARDNQKLPVIQL
ncbi:hypothetical protein KFU94_19330 [Chloroflexi bacterium TSY]|nr:hypothetical protein [Chloroflexi bacterium TSY]